MSNGEIDRGKASKIISDFYGRVLRSPRLGRFFTGVHMQGLVAHQTAFLHSVLGGPAAHSDEELAVVHEGMGISDADYDEMLELLRQAMVRQDVEDEVVTRVLDEYQARRHLIVAD